MDAHPQTALLNCTNKCVTVNLAVSRIRGSEPNINVEGGAYSYEVPSTTYHENTSAQGPTLLML